MNNKRNCPHEHIIRTSDGKYICQDCQREIPVEVLMAGRPKKK